MVVDGLAAAFSLPFRRESDQADLSLARGRIGGRDVILAKPLAYMNLSGPPVRELARQNEITCRDMLIIYDDMDLAFGRIKITEKGGHGGHKGIQSLIDAFGCDDFPRIRVGIGHPEPSIDVVDYVLAEFQPEEKRLLAQVLDRAREAAVSVLCEGATRGMNRFNTKRVNFIS